jgi:hypothetical protein
MGPARSWAGPSNHRKKDMESSRGRNEGRDNTPAFFYQAGLGAGLGIVLGIVVFALTQNAVWIGIGIVVGAALGIVVGAVHRANP